MKGPVMADQLVNLGIAAMACSFSEDQDVKQTAGDYVTDPERVIRWGYHTFHRSADGVTPVALATRAARAALSRADVEPSDLDLVVVATSEMPEYPYWDSAAGLAREL